MNTQELIARVAEAVKDGSFTDAEILTRLNDWYAQVCHDFCFPELEATTTVSFAAGGDTFAALPADYHHDLWHIDPVTTTTRISVMTSLQSLQRLYGPDESGGPIMHAAVDGSTLHVRPAPTTAQDVTIYYYSIPDALTDESTSSPVGIPSHLHAKVLTSRVVADLFDIIEDGVDGSKANTARWEGLTAQAISELEQYARRAPRLRPFVKRHPRYF